MMLMVDMKSRVKYGSLKCETFVGRRSPFSSFSPIPNGQVGHMTDPFSKQSQPDGQAVCTGSAVRRTVSVKGSGGIAAVVVVIAQWGQVWVPIVPLLT